MVCLERRSDGPQHLDRTLLVRLLDLHHLEAAGERRVLLEVTLVLGPGGRGDGAKLAARERRLQQVRRITLAFSAPRPDERMRFVDEQDRRLHCGADLLDHRLQAVLELALHTRPRLQKPQIERAQTRVAKGGGHVARSDPQRETFDHGRLPDPRLTRQQRIVLAPPQEDVDHLPDLVVATADRVDLARQCLLGQVDGVLIQRRRTRRMARSAEVAAPLRGGCRRSPIAGGFRRGADELGQTLPQRLPRDLEQRGGRFQDHAPHRLVFQQCEQERPRTDGVLTQLQRRDQPRPLQQARHVGREGRSAGIAALHAVQRLGQLAECARRIPIVLAQDQVDVASIALQQPEEHVLDLHIIVRTLDAKLRRALEHPAARRIQPADQRSEFSAHRCSPNALIRRRVLGRLRH